MPTDKVTLEDIAQRAGVSTAAVSQALSGKGALSQATRQRILQVVEELAYQPDRTAQNLALRRASQAAGKRLGRARGLPPSGMMVFYDIPELLEVVHLEIQQRQEEGYEVRRCGEQLAAWKRPTKQQIYRLYAEVLAAPLRPDFAGHEPETLPEIQAARPAGPRAASLSLTPQALDERLYGAWLGRAVGCVLGKPLQAGWSKGQALQYLQLAGSYPLHNYIPRLLPPPPGFVFKTEAAGCFLGEVHGAPCDDDTDYTILALHLLETYGLDFKTADVATEWLGHLSYFGVYTTERAVYRNLVWNVHPEETAAFVNPEREFIGARTRADLYGYIAPGKPALAASLAYRDAALSHTKNGVYSAMWMAAMLAWAFVSDDLEEVVRVGLSEIPANCRLALALQEALSLYREGCDWEAAYDRLLLKYGAYSPIHAINNALWAALALLFSDGDFERALSIAVACGMDTGSNAASAGSLLGLIYTSRRLPAQWIEPLHDTLSSAVAQFPETRLSELARRTAKLAQNTLIFN